MTEGIHRNRGGKSNSETGSEGKRYHVKKCDIGRDFLRCGIDRDRCVDEIVLRSVFLFGKRFE